MTVIPLDDVERAAATVGSTLPVRGGDLG